MLIYLLGIIASLLVSIFAYLKYTSSRNKKYFEERGIPYLGNEIINLLYISIKGISITDNLIQEYQKVKKTNSKFGCGIENGKPTFFITDLELVKQIMVKDFDHFVDRGSFAKTENDDDLITKMLMALEGDKWKALRTKMSPTFTTGKIRKMFQILDKSGKRMVEYLQEQTNGSGVVDLQEGYSKFTMDVIASAAFGIDSKAFEQSDPSLFEQMAAKLQFKLGFVEVLRFVVLIATPKLAKALGFTIFSRDAQQFFSTVIKSAIKMRQNSNERREDFLQLMLDAREGQLKTTEAENELSEYEKAAQLKSESSVTKVSLEDDDIAAQSVLFILGGFDTTQGLLLFAGYNLALFPEMQERLRQEVQNALDENEGELTYESVNQMEYMEMFISETLRIYPPALVIQRTCTQDYKISGTDETIKKGSPVNLPIYGFHRDEDYYPEPEKFDPERFSPINRSKIHQYSYLPFGIGPRSCIAMRLALVEVKVAIAHLVLNFTMEPSEKTPIPMKYAKLGTLKPADGLWLKLQSRK